MSLDQFLPDNTAHVVYSKGLGHDTFVDLVDGCPWSGYTPWLFLLCDDLVRDLVVEQKL